MKAKMVEILLRKSLVYFIRQHLFLYLCCMVYGGKKGPIILFYACYAFMRNLYKIYRKHRLLMINCLHIK